MKTSEKILGTLIFILMLVYFLFVISLLSSLLFKKQVSPARDNKGSCYLVRGYPLQ